MLQTWWLKLSLKDTLTFLSDKGNKLPNYIIKLYCIIHKPLFTYNYRILLYGKDKKPLIFYS